MASREVHLALLAIVAASIPIAVAEGFLRLGDRASSGDEVLVLQFPRHPTAYCGYHGFPEAPEARSTLRFNVLQRSDDGRTIRDTLNCTLAGDMVDFRLLAEDNKLTYRRSTTSDAELEVTMGRVQCVLEPRHVPGALFDFRATRRGSDLPPFQCLMVAAPRDLAPPFDARAALPDRDALAFRFQKSTVPDLVCQSFSDVPLEQSGIEAQLLGFLNRASGPLNCHFKHIYEGQSTPSLLDALSQELGLGLDRRPGRPPTLTMPSFTCGAARRADDIGVGPDDAVPASFAVTGPNSRWALCRIRSAKASELPRIEFPNMPPIFCTHQGIPVGAEVDGTDVYFILRTNRSVAIYCKLPVTDLPRPGSGDVSLLREILEKSAPDLGGSVRSNQEGVLVLQVPSFLCAEDAAGAATLPEGVRFKYHLPGTELFCVLMMRRPRGD